MTEQSTAAAPAPSRDERRYLDLALADTLNGASVISARESLVAALADGPATVLLDVSSVTHVTASGLAGTLELLHVARSRGGDLRLFGGSEAVAAAQQATRLGSVTTVYPDRDQALAADGLRPSAPEPAPPSAARARMLALEARLKADISLGALLPEPFTATTSTDPTSADPTGADPTSADPTSADQADGAGKAPKAKPAKPKGKRAARKARRSGRATKEARADVPAPVESGDDASGRDREQEAQ